MRFLLSLTSVLLVACAGTPPAPPAQAPANSASTHEPADADAQNAADRRFAEAVRSYKLVERNGDKYYCRAERASGSNIKAQNCFSEAELRSRVESAEIYRRRPKPAVCAPNDPRCGGS
jgi:hypothetical protein